MTNIKVTPQGSAASHELTATTGVFWKRDDLQLRKFNKPVSLEDVRQAVKNNNLDEIVFKTTNGDRYVVYADELNGKVKAGDAVEIGGIRGTVELVDNEVNKTRCVVIAGVAIGVAAVATGGALGVAAGAAAAVSPSLVLELGTLGMMAGSLTVVGGMAAAGKTALERGFTLKEDDTGIKTMSTGVQIKKR